MDLSVSTVDESSDNGPALMGSLSDMPLHEWVAALTHPDTGPFPNGVTTRMMDSLVRQNGVRQFPSADRRRYHTVWKTIGHFAVYLSDATRKGKIRRIALGTYSGIFNKSSGNGKSAKLTAISSDPSADSGLNRTSNKRKSSLPRRHPITPQDDKGTCPSPVTGTPGLLTQGETSERPISSDSMHGNSASSIEELKNDHEKNSAVLPKLHDGGKGTQWIAIKPAIASVNGHCVASYTHTATVSAKTPLNENHGHQQRPQSQQCKKMKITHDHDEYDLASLAKLDPCLKEVSMSSLSALTTQDIQRVCQKLGFQEGANALKREEVDGLALLLLRREDIMNSMGLKLGPALKLHRFVHTLQSYAKGSR